MIIVTLNRKEKSERNSEKALLWREKTMDLGHLARRKNSLNLWRKRGLFSKTKNLGGPIKSLNKWHDFWNLDPLSSVEVIIKNTKSNWNHSTTLLPTWRERSSICKLLAISNRTANMSFWMWLAVNGKITQSIPKKLGSGLITCKNLKNSATLTSSISKHKSSTTCQAHSHTDK